MKFLIIAGSLKSIVLFRKELISSLQAKGLEIHVMAAQDDCKSRDYLEYKKVIVHDIPLHRNGVNFFQDIYLFFYLFFSMRRISPDFILAYTIKPVLYGLLAAWLIQVKYRFALITGLGYIFTSSNNFLLNYFIKSFYKFVLNRVNKVFFPKP